MRATIALLCTAVISCAAPAARAATHPDQAAKAEMVETVQTASAIAGSVWQCNLSEGIEAHFAVNFEADGRFYVTRDGVRDTFPGEWNRSGSDVQWSDAAGRLYTLSVSGDALKGRTSTLDLRQSRGRVYAGTIACSRKTEIRLAQADGR